MNNVKAEVIGFDNGSVYQSIVNFLHDESLSVNTRKAYQKDIDQFFKYINKKKDVTQLTEEDLTSIKNEDIKRYRNYLKGTGMANTTVNRKIRSVYSLFTDLSKDRPHLHPARLQIKPLPERENHYGDFTKEEIDIILEYVKTKHNGLEKSLLIELAILTSYRKDYLLNLTWDDIKKHSDDIYVIKGKEVESKKREEDKSITKVMYNKLTQIKVWNPNNKVFQIASPTVQLMMKDIISTLNLDLDGDRNLSFHSFKNYGINMVYEKTRDVRLMAKQGNHKNPATTLARYARLSNNPEQNPSLIVAKDTDMSVLDSVNLDQLLQAINKCDDFVKNTIAEKLKDIIG